MRVERGQDMQRKGRMVDIGRKLYLSGWLLLLLLALSGCESAPKKKPIYSYELPWSGKVIRADTLSRIDGNPFDGNKRLDAYLQARKQAEEILLQQIRKLYLTDQETVGEAIDQKPAVMKRIRRFLDHAKVDGVAYDPTGGIRVQETAYLGADFQSLLGVTLHLMPRKKKKIRGAATAAHEGGSGAGGMPMMPMMP